MQTSPKNTPHFILASASPRRVQLLAQIGITPDAIIPADSDETPLKNELVTDYVTRIAAQKARAIAEKYPNSCILAADTAVSCGRRILPKAEDARTARQCLELLNGRRHRVYTAICIKHNGKTYQKRVCTTVMMQRLNAAEIERYVASNEWHGKAGGYGIQGLAEAFIPWMNGSYSNVVGLPLAQTSMLLQQCGIASAKEQAA